MNRQSVVFCALALAASLLVSAVGFRLAALPPEVVDAARRAAPPETLPDVDLGEGFGRVSVIDLVAYYVENPPASPRARASAQAPDAAAAPARRFGGC